MVGWGNVRWPYLIARTLVVTLGTMLTIKAAQFAFRQYVTGPTRSVADEDVDLEDITEEDDSTKEEAEAVDMEKPEDELENQAEAEELADVVSQTMAEDEDERE